MIAPVLYYLTLGATLGAGLIAGVFFAFSSFVMPALAKLPAEQGLAAMQSINVAVLNRSFLGVFVGTAVFCSLAAVLSLSTWSLAGSQLRVVGSISYIVGTFLVTMSCNVPLNDGLANVCTDPLQAVQKWSSYVSTWTAYNTMRALAALAAAALLTLSLAHPLTSSGAD
jgi:uncharacterized membrane protein